MVVMTPLQHPKSSCRIFDSSWRVRSLRDEQNPFVLPRSTIT